MKPAPKVYALKLSAAEMERVRDLTDNRATSITVFDGEAERERQLLQGIVRKIDAFGPLREMRGKRFEPKTAAKIGPRAPGSGLARRTKGGGR